MTYALEFMTYDLVPMHMDLVWTCLDYYETLRLTQTYLRSLMVIPMLWSTYAWTMDYGIWTLDHGLKHTSNHMNKP